jgi:hypothetical protein
LEGDPPQRDGFEPDLRGAREIDLFIHCPPDEPGVLRGTILKRGRRQDLLQGSGKVV